MQFIRNSLSFSFTGNQPTPPNGGDGTTANGTGETKANDGGKVGGPSPSPSNASDRSQYATVRSKLPLNLGSPPSAYSTPFQSPVIASRTYPTLASAAATLNRDDSGNGTMKPAERSSKVYFVEQGQLQTEYELPERPAGARRGASVDNGIVNPAFVNDSGAPTVINMSGTHPSVIREQYWTWSCRCRRELTSREKALLIVIFILVLVIGGLATYLGIVVDSDDGITGGILTRDVLQTIAQE
uniref:Uncharacterized protein n=1 Tax=Anopheles dirus TaxID=7168 RepID=A0A182NAS8_9DIPT